MPFVEFLAWEVDEPDHASHRDRRAWHAERVRSVEALLNDLSTLEEDLVQKRAREVLAGGLVRLPVADLDQANLLAEALRRAGGRIRVRQMEDAAFCSTCETFTVISVGEDPPGLQAFACCGCDEIKRACGACGGQGWLLHYVAEDPAWEGYICDECHHCRDLDWRQVSAVIRQDLRRVVDVLGISAEDR